jgi:hypothetical protein
MSLLAKESGSQMEFETVPAGVYTALCYRVIDLGTQTTEFAGEIKEGHKVMISWELFGEGARMTDGRPFSVHKQYKISLHEKATLRKDLEAWRGKKFTADELEGFDVANVLGTACMMQVVLSEDGKFANVGSIMSTKEKPTGENEPVLFIIDDKATHATWSNLSRNLQEKILSSPEGMVSGLQPTEREARATSSAATGDPFKN